jgi:DNA-binding NtrC family response regulator
MGREPRLLLVDDEYPVREILARYARGCGFEVDACSDGRQALEHLEANSADVALVDLRMPHLNGLEVLRTIREKDAHCQVVLMSGAGTIGDAVEAIKLGARDYFQKPFELHVFRTLLDQVKRDFERRKNVLEIESRLVPELDFCGMIGRGAIMQELFGLIGRLAPHVKTALITGESGSGKELVAHALHRLGPRAPRELVTVDCPGLTDSQAESDLFGHVHGAFPGATEDRAGAFEKADGGVLFLDEAGELPMAVQGRLLRVLEHGEIHRVGSLEARHVDVIVIAATKRDLRTEMMAGRFRPELYYRLSTATIHVPPLAARMEDIPYLTAAFVTRFSGRLQKRIAGLTAQAEALLHRRDWKGNVRELANVIERACILADGEFITERQIVQALE